MEAMSPTLIVLAVLTLYLAGSLWVGWRSWRQGAATLDDYFVASRRISPLVLFCTLAATNFSAFFFLGFAGASYRLGWPFYGLMAFGTSLVGLSILLLGVPIYKLGKAKGYLTPPELITGESGSQMLGWLYGAVLVIFTLPYLAVQPYGAGLVLESLTDGGIDGFHGAVLLTGVMLIYIWLGGMRSSVWTDLLQGGLMLGLMLTAVLVVMQGLGGFGAAGGDLAAAHPQKFMREGAVTWQVWLSYTLLWPMVVPMFPQLFSRFYIAESDKALRTAAWLYPTIVPLLFLAPVLLGVSGNLDFPELAKAESDSIVPILLLEHAPLWLAALVMTGALAAFMSTADSQLLAMSSILTRDIAASITELKEDEQYSLGRWLVVALAIVGLALAYDPPDTIFNVVSQAFTGLAVLFPTTVALLWWRHTRSEACIASILTGETLVAWTYLAAQGGGIPEWFTQGFHPSMPIIFLSAVILIVGSLLLGKDSET
jgi:SSS family solute:Na+ symporter|tara:strand:+ start:247 stop:1698 length:1452 start_codon:yes stop_codon:yes gene_type:complete